MTRFLTTFLVSMAFLLFSTASAAQVNSNKGIGQGESVLIGAAAGALLGSSVSDNNRGESALIGAAIGATAGAVLSSDNRRTSSRTVHQSPRYVYPRTSRYYRLNYDNFPQGYSYYQYYGYPSGIYFSRSRNRSFTTRNRNFNRRGFTARRGIRRGF